MSRLMALIGLALLLASVGARAHHGGGVYDGNKTVELSGTVTQFHFVNPHVLIYIAVENEDGTETEWSGELTSPNRLARMGNADVRWHKDLLQPGDEISLMGNPARNGAPALRLLRVAASDGTVLIGGER